jgi:hypothetical protein
MSKKIWKYILRIYIHILCAHVKFRENPTIYVLYVKKPKGGSREPLF